MWFPVAVWWFRLWTTMSVFTLLLHALSVCLSDRLSVCMFACMSVSACVCSRHWYMCDKQMEGDSKATTNHSAAVYFSTVSHQPKQVWPPTLCLCDELWPAAYIYLWWWPRSLCFQQVSKLFFTDAYFLCNLCRFYLNVAVTSQSLAIVVICCLSSLSVCL